MYCRMSFPISPLPGMQLSPVRGNFKPRCLSSRKGQARQGPWELCYCNWAVAFSCLFEGVGIVLLVKKNLEFRVIRKHFAPQTFGSHPAAIYRACSSSLAIAVPMRFYNRRLESTIKHARSCSKQRFDGIQHAICKTEFHALIEVPRTPSISHWHCLYSSAIDSGRLQHAASSSEAAR